jgi:DNA-binding IclR family transcriptional regulator
MTGAPVEKETSLRKALRLLFTVGESPDPAGVSVIDLAKETGLSRPTAYRFLRELQQTGLVQPVAKQSTWQLGPKVVALAAMAGNWSRLRRRAREAMEEFVQSVGYTVHLGIRDRFEVVYIDKAESARYATIASMIGQRRPLHVTALGKCLTAFDANPRFAELVADNGLPARTEHSISDPKKWLQEIEKVRQEGIATDMEECDVGARCVAAPILDAQGYAVAAISSSALSVAGQELDFPHMTEEIRRLARDVSLFASSAGA